MIERNDTLYYSAADGTGYTERTVVARIQADSTLKQVSVLTFPFASKTQRVEWEYARVRHSDGTSTETPVAGAMEVVEPVTREAPFYSDLKQSQLPLRDLRVGDTLEWKGKVVRTAAEAPGEFWDQKYFTRDGVELSEKLVLDVPSDKYVNVWSPQYKPEETIAGGRHTYVWQYEQKKPTVGPEADAAKEAEKKRVRTPEEEIDFREGKLPDVAWSTFKSWEAVGAWYRGMEGSRMVPDAEIKAKVAQITAGKTTEQQKIEAVYAYVATQIHYIGVAFGIGRYQPHGAADVLQNQYGDCKDKHTLLASMLNALGLNPDAVLIGAGIRFNEAVPAPSAFNHLITHVMVEGKPVWLDTTAEVAPYGMLLYVTRDHDALVVPESGVAKVEKTPKNPPFQDSSSMDAVGKLDADGTSISRLTLTFRGDDEIVFRSVLRQVSPAQYDQVAQQMCANMGYAGTASHLEVSRIEDTSEPLKVSFDYKREKAGDWPNYRTIPQLSPVSLAKLDDKDPPVQAVSLGYPRVEVSHSAMNLPDGWGVEFPEAVHERSVYATYDQTYRFEKGTMYAERRVEVLQERVPVSDWKTYNKFANKADLGNEQYIQLIRNTGAKNTSSSASIKTDGAPTTEVTTSSSATSAKPSELMDQASQAFQNSDLKKAESLLDQVKAIDPKQSRLWASYSYLAFRKGDLPETIKDDQKELVLHPANTFVYPDLIRAQIAMKQKDQAVESLKQWINADPADAQPALQLANMEMLENKPEEAVKTAETVLARTPSDEKKNERLQILLGRAELKAGMKEQGHQTLVALLKSTDDSGVMNDTAYELADAGFELPLAEKTTQTALETMEEQSRAWTLDENLQTVRGKSRLLQATWDTMGWVYFRAGRLTEAQKYIDASWKGRQDATVGGHVAEVALARGDKNAALTAYDLALACFTPYDMMGVRTDPSPEQKEMQARTAALRRAGAHSGVADPKAALQKLRMIPLGPAAGLDGVAEYKLLVSGSSVLRAKPIGTKTLPGGEERLKKAPLTALFPASSNAHLVLAGLLNCHSGVCELALEP